MAKVLLSTMNEVPGHDVVELFGLVRGLTVRSRSMVGNLVAGVEAVFGGRNLTYTELCEVARSEATLLVMAHAAEVGANAVLALRYDTTEVTPGITEVLAYGTAVLVEPIQGHTPAVKINVPDVDLMMEPESCLSCGGSIPPAAKACPHCGWTWIVEE